MGRLIISTHMTVDGVIGPSPQDWATFDDEGERYKFDQLLAADAFLLGRKVYQGLASVWPTITDDTGFADRVNSIPSTSPPGPCRNPSTGTRRWSRATSPRAWPASSASTAGT